MIYLTNTNKNDILGILSFNLVHGGLYYADYDHILNIYRLSMGGYRDPNDFKHSYFFEFGCCESYSFKECKIDIDKLLISGWKIIER